MFVWLVIIGWTSKVVLCSDLPFNVVLMLMHSLADFLTKSSNGWTLSMYVIAQVLVEYKTILCLIASHRCTTRHFPDMSYFAIFPRPPLIDVVFPHLTIPCKIVFVRLDYPEIRSYYFSLGLETEVVIRGLSTAWYSKDFDLVPWTVYRMPKILHQHLFPWLVFCHGSLRFMFHKSTGR